MVWSPNLGLLLVGVAFFEEDWRMVIFQIVGFLCLLQPGEILALQWQDLVWTGEDQPWTVIKIRNPKTLWAQIQHIV